MNGSNSKRQSMGAKNHSLLPMGSYSSPVQGNSISNRFSAKPGAEVQPLSDISGMCDSVVGVYNDPDCSENSRFIIVGAIGKGGCLDLYNPQMDSWEICPPLPEIFRPGNSLKSLSSALFRGKFYVFGIHSSFISCFDLKKRSWSSVQTLRPPGVMFSYLISCGDRLVLAGVCSVNDEPEFILWRIDETTLEFREIGIMPQELLSCFFGSEGEWRFGSLKCVGMGNIVYVFSEERNRNYTACFCEITSSGKCRWRKVPDLPDHVNKLHKTFSFCCNVSLQDILENGRV
ncbi:hypothetical protein RD792_003241 [Penstemon davidsonii]|uniref:F-box/kelch-repeat protein n=1 Tax=Penstemon davidsonii TaxID=160366 RepID=A0ABR0DUC8_9LAMI|nr:hypothetical protein RD792_003241 [Penstemon davidsonii]